MSTVRETLARILGDYVLIDAVDITDDADLVCDLGLGTVDLVTVAAQAATKLNIKIDGAEAADWKTFGDMLATVEALTEGLAAITGAEHRLFVGMDMAELDRLTRSISGPIEALIDRWPADQAGAQLLAAATLRALLINQARIITRSATTLADIPALLMGCEAIVRDRVQQASDRILLEISRG